jgi:hypothetical protein
MEIRAEGPQGRMRKEGQVYLIFEDLIQAEWIDLPKSPQFCPVLRETVFGLHFPYALLHFTNFPSSPYETHTQHRVIAFYLT